MAPRKRRGSSRHSAPPQTRTGRRISALPRRSPDCSGWPSRRRPQAAPRGRSRHAAGRPRGAPSAGHVERAAVVIEVVFVIGARVKLVPPC